MKHLVLLFALAIGLVGQASAEPSCRKVDTYCISGLATDPFYKQGITQIMPCMTFSGENVCLTDVGQTCWGKKSTYECRSPNTIDDCQPLRDRGCGQIGSKCITSVDGGACSTLEMTFQCTDKAESWSEKTVCDTSTFCQNSGTCFDTSTKQDTDFAKSIVMMEAAREAGVYGVNANSVEMFKGNSDSCSIKVAGGATINSCCKVSGGGGLFSNYAAIGGSMYMFDSLYGAGAVGVVAALLQCSESEKKLGLKRGQNLCVQVDSYCSTKLLGICIERKEDYCCFNSKLAKIINRQGRAQLGLPSKQCGGFSQSQISQLDFSRMDLSEFIADITPKNVNTGAMSNKVNQSVQQRVNNYYNQ